MEPPSDGLKTSTRKRSLAEIFSQGVVVLRISGIGDIGSSAERVMEGAQVFTKKKRRNREKRYRSIITEE